MKKLPVVILLVFAAFLSTVSAAPINQVSYATLTGTGLVTFDDIPGGPAPGTNYNSIFESGGADFGERFLGQTLTNVSNFDQLSGSPSSTLQLVAGATNQNLGVYSYSTNVMYGLGSLGYPSYEAIGEGAFAVLFDYDQSEFGFQLVGGNAGSAYVSFFRRDGSLIAALTIANLAEDSYGFLRESGINDIAGISIWNDDLAGIGFDNLKHDVPGPSGVPEPGTIMLLGVGLVGIAGIWRKKFRK